MQTRQISIIIFFISSSAVFSTLLDTSGDLLSRQKRTLVWKEGINWVQMIAGVGIPIELRNQAITIGTVVKAYYILPNNSTYYTHPSIDYARKKRSSTRWITYNLIESFLQRNGYGDGKACLLRSICEAASDPFERKSGILAEIIHAILTPSSTRELYDNHLNSEYHAAEKLGKEASNCAALFQECPLNFIRQFTRFLS